MTKNQSDSKTKAELLTKGRQVPSLRKEGGGRGGAGLRGEEGRRRAICEGEMGRLQTYPRQQRAPGGGNIAQPCQTENSKTNTNGNS